MSDRFTCKGQHFIRLDFISEKRLLSRHANLSRALAINVFIIFLFEACLVGASVTTAVVWWKFPVGWLPLFHSLTAFRLVFILAALCFRRLDPTKLMGMSYWHKIHRYLWTYPELGTWYLLGYLDFVIRCLAFLADIPLLFASERGITFQCLAIVIADVLYIFETFVAVHLVYYDGVLNNLACTLSRRRSDIMIPWRADQENEDDDEEEKRTKKRKKRRKERVRDA
jgi:hypothetical protein